MVCPAVSVDPGRPRCVLWACGSLLSTWRPLGFYTYLRAPEGKVGSHRGELWFEVAVKFHLHWLRAEDCSLESR